MVPTLGKPNSKLQQVHLYEKDHPTENQSIETPTQAMVHECLTECGMDPSDIHNVMSAVNAKGGISSQDSPRKIQVHYRYVIQFPPEMDENWVRYGLAKLGQISRLPNWQKIVVLCVHNTTSALNS